MTHRPKAELLINGVWTDVTSRLRRRSPVTVQRGRDDELAQATPSKVGMVLDNADGALTPRNPESLWYPHWARGTRCRVWSPGGTTALVCDGVTGNYASTPDTAVLDITGTITVLAKIDPEAWAGRLTYTGNSVTRGTTHWIATKWVASGNQRSWFLAINPTGQLAFQWTVSGTLASSVGRTSAEVVSFLRPAWVGVTLTPNNGAGGNTIQWWASEDGVTFTELSSQTESGTSSIFSSSAPVEVGAINGGTETFQGRIHAVTIVNGTFLGTVVANPDFTTQTPGARSFTDAAGRAWSVNGTAEISDYTIRGVGQIDEINVDWPHAEHRDSPRDGVSHVTVSASGMLRRMGQGAKPVVSTLFRGITRSSVASNIKAYWPLEDGPDATRAASPIDGVRPMNIGAPGDLLKFASDSSLPSSKPVMSSTTQIAFAGRIPTYSSTQTRIDIFVKIDTPNPIASGGTFIAAVDVTGSPATRWTYAVDDTNITVLATDVTGATVDTLSVPSIPEMFGVWCLWSLNIQQNGGNVEWDLDVVPLDTGIAISNSGDFAGTVGVAHTIHNWLTNAPITDGISFGHIIISTGLVLGWLAGYDTAWAGETAAHRFFRLCGEEDVIPQVFGDDSVLSSFRGDETLSAPMGYQGQKTLVDLLTECAVVDGGILSEHRTAPVLCYRTRRSLYNQDTALRLDTKLQGVDREFTPVDDDQRVRNNVTATRTGGSSARVTTTPPPGPGEVYDVDINLNVHHDGQLPDQAGWRLHLGTWPAMRYPGLGTSLRRAGTYVAKTWSDIALGDRVTLDNLPTQHQKDADVLLEGYTETLSFFDWTAALNASPAGPWTVGVREDDVLGIRDTAGSVLDASFAAGTATTMDVETTVGPLWAVTAAANSGLPFDLNVGGYRITATAIGAAAGQVQTFTVSATIQNGLAPRTLAAGTAVSLWQPARRAL